MKIGSLSEDKDLEKRISITPEIAKKYIRFRFRSLFGFKLWFSFRI